jgi:hypothetical protein
MHAAGTAPTLPHRAIRNCRALATAPINPGAQWNSNGPAGATRTIACLRCTAGFRQNKATPILDRKLEPGFFQGCLLGPKAEIPNQWIYVGVEGRPARHGHATRARYNARSRPGSSKAKQCQTDPAEYKYARSDHGERRQSDNGLDGRNHRTPLQTALIFLAINFCANKAKTCLD